MYFDTSLSFFINHLISTVNTRLPYTTFLNKQTISLGISIEWFFYPFFRIVRLSRASRTWLPVKTFCSWPQTNNGSAETTLQKPPRTLTTREVVIFQLSSIKHGAPGENISAQDIRWCSGHWPQHVPHLINQASACLYSAENSSRSGFFLYVVLKCNAIEICLNYMIWIILLMFRSSAIFWNPKSFLEDHN